MTKQQGPRPKHIPQRTCIACRRTDAKRGLIRLMRLPDGHVAIDPTGKRSGRGAYLCAERTCWETAIKRKAIARALKLAQLDPADEHMLATYATTLPLNIERGTDTMAPPTS